MLRTPLRKMKVNRLITITVCISIGLVVWQFLISSLPLLFQWIFFSVFVFFIGIPHGALDLYVQQKSDQLSGRKFRTLSFIVKYCILILLYVFTWYLFPLTAFVLFVVISCLHFGETDFSFFTSSPASSSLTCFLYSVSLLLILLIPHSKEVSVVLLQLLPAYKSLPDFLLSIQFYATVILILAGVCMILVLTIAFIGQKLRFKTGALLQLLVLLTCCGFLPLLPAFALYFVGWHSLISLQQIGQYIKSSNTELQNHNVVLPLLKKGFPFSLMAIAGLAIAVILYYYFKASFHLLPLVLVFLSVITLPHLGVMNELNKRKPAAE